MPTGFAALPPPGPATPVTASATVPRLRAERARAISRAVSSLTAPCFFSVSSLHAEQLALGGVRIGDEAALEPVATSRRPR